MPPPADPPPREVLWQIQAQLGRRLTRPDDGGTGEGEWLTAVSRALAEAFGGKRLIIKEVLGGFTPKSDREILDVEVCEPCLVTGDVRSVRSYVVKVGLRTQLSAELANWVRTAPPGMKSDVVFLPVEALPSEADQPLMCLAYDNALRFIGTDQSQIATLEKAVIEAVRGNNPLIGSVIEVVTQLLERVGLLFHLYGKPVPAGTDPFTTAEEAAAAGRLAEWGETKDGLPTPADPDRARELADFRLLVRNWVTEVSRPPRPGPPGDDRTAPVPPTLLYRDPVDHFRKVFLAARRPAGGEEPAVVAPGPGPRPFAAKDLIPSLVRGPAHGDLHGRNVLVGVTRRRAVWPAVFDYEDMGPKNLVGWDYVKLETELKVRAYPAVFAPKPDREFAELVQQFELELADRTDYRSDRQAVPPGAEPPDPARPDEGLRRAEVAGVVYADAWPEFDPGSDPRGRLMAVLLTIRQMAALHLGVFRHRRRAVWHEEYFFLLAWYAVVTGKFNLLPRQRTAALISGGTAVARLNAVRDRFRDEHLFARTLYRRPEG